MEAQRSRKSKKPFNEMTIDELYGECEMKKMDCCKDCSAPVSECDTLEGYCLKRAARIIRAARKYVALRDQSGYDAQMERREAWDELKGAVG